MLSGIKRWLNHVAVAAAPGLDPSRMNRPSCGMASFELVVSLEFRTYGAVSAKISFRNPCLSTMYPAPLTDDPERWRRYVMDALVETTISRDVLLLTRVDKPALLRRLFELGCRYSGQILSYNKKLGRLQDAGNTTTLAHYLDLLAGVGMLTDYRYSPARRSDNAAPVPNCRYSIRRCSRPCPE